jgi:hypothetical protein
MNPAEAYILGQEEPFRNILVQLQALIEGLVPGVCLKYKYRIPFYYLNEKPFCYLNQSRDYVDLGLVRGNQLTLYKDQMVTADRKQVASLRYFKTEDIDYEILKEVLQEALHLHPGPVTG